MQATRTPSPGATSARAPVLAAVALLAASAPAGAVERHVIDTLDQTVTLEVRSGGLRLDLDAPQFPDAPEGLVVVRDHRGTSLGWSVTASFEPADDQNPLVTWAPTCTLVNDTDDVIWTAPAQPLDGTVAACSAEAGADGISSNVVVLDAPVNVSGILTITLA